MALKKACKNCKMLYAGSNCPNCKSNQSTDNWKGRIIILDAKQSEIAKKIGTTSEGEYCIKMS